MNTEEVVVKPLPPLLVAELSAVAENYEPSSIGPVLTPLYPELFRRMAEAELPMAGAPLAYYEPVPDDDAVVCHAAVPVREVPAGDRGLSFVELPGIEQAATLIHHGPMDEADTTMQTLARWIDGHGYRPVADGLAREVYIDYDPAHPETGVTEMQVAVTRP